jgi:pyruvate kinase
VIAVTQSAAVAGMLALYRGLTPVITPARDLEALERLLIERRLVAAGSVVVFISVNSDMTRTDANYVNVQKIG